MVSSGSQGSLGGGQGEERGEDLRRGPFGRVCSERLRWFGEMTLEFMCFSYFVRNRSGQGSREDRKY